MFIAHVQFTVDQSNQQKALDALLAEAPVVRKMQGCVTFTPFLDPTRPGGLGVVHEWQDHERFVAYLESPGFNEASQVLRPLMTDTPVSKRFEVRVLATVN